MAPRVLWAGKLPFCYADQFRRQIRILQHPKFPLILNIEVDRLPDTIKCLLRCIAATGNLELRASETYTPSSSWVRTVNRIFANSITRNHYTARRPAITSFFSWRLFGRSEIVGAPPTTPGAKQKSSAEQTDAHA